MLRALGIDTFAVRHAPCAQQTDGHNCGICVVAFVHCVARGSSPSMQLDWAAYRAHLAKLLVA